MREIVLTQKCHLRRGKVELRCCMNTVPVATFNDPEPAQKLHERLRQAGIPASIHDESKIERFWFMEPALAAVHVEVPQPQYLKARLMIDDWDQADGALRSAVRCPECASSRVEFPQLTRKFVTPTLARIFMALRVLGPEFYCMDCHFTWPIAVPVQRELDILGFPRASKKTHPRQRV